MAKFKFQPDNIKDQVWAWIITAASEDEAWQSIADIKKIPIDKLKTFIKIKKEDFPKDQIFDKRWTSSYT
tara:strand:+ start:470 stop:679 length:210 start_codon:yes stop_codon:yes gene_type:complete